MRARLPLAIMIVAVVITQVAFATALQCAGPDTYVPVAKLVNQPNVLMVRTEARWKTAKEFLSYAGAHPGEITVGVAGRATVGFDATLGTFQAIIAPSGTPASIVEALAEAVRRAMSEPSFISLVEETGNTIEYEGPEPFAADLRGKFQKNGELVRALGLSK